MQKTINKLFQPTDIQTGLLLAIGGTALFGLKSIFIKLAYEHGVDTITLLTMRMLIAMPFYVLMMIWMLRKKENKRPQKNDWLGILVLGFMGYYLASLLDMEGLNHITAQLERLTLYTYPVMATLLGWLFMREVITRRILMALGLTYTGVVVLYAHESLNTHDANTTLGVVLVMTAALSFSCYVVFSRPYIKRLGSRLFTSLAMLASTTAVFIHFMLTRDVSALFAYPPAWKYGFLLAVFSTLLPSFMMSEAISRLGSGRTSIVGTFGPVFTIFIAVLVLGEPFGTYHLAGMVLVLWGISLLGKQ